MTYPVDYMNALMTISAALLAIAGIVIGFMATREGQFQNRWGKVVITTSTFSVISGIAAMMYVLEWFNTPIDYLKADAVWSIIVQFLLVFIPLIIVGLVFSNEKKGKLKQPPD